MAVHQIEEYYICMNFDKPLTSNQKSNIEELLSGENYSNYEFQRNGTVLVVDDVESQEQGEVLEARIEKELAL